MSCTASIASTTRDSGPRRSCGRSTWFAATPADELAARAADETLTDLDGIGDSTARVITEALRGETPAYLTKLEGESQVSITPEGERYRAALRGDCHLHSTWSDGGALIEDMAATAMALGHEYMVLTDHSARLTIAHGLSEERLLAQLEVIAGINHDITTAGHDFRILTGMEVDILEDGTLDLADELLARLDVVVGSVHSKLRMERQQMTERMVMAVASPHVDILGHCTGRMIGKRPPSTFDADFVFAACAQFGTAVEINCRPERLDPPDELIDLAIDMDVGSASTPTPMPLGSSSGNRTAATAPPNAMSRSNGSSTPCRRPTCWRGPPRERTGAADRHGQGRRCVRHRQRQGAAALPHRPRLDDRGGGDAPRPGPPATPFPRCTTPTDEIW